MRLANGGRGDRVMLTAPFCSSFPLLRSNQVMLSNRTKLFLIAESKTQPSTSLQIFRIILHRRQFRIVHRNKRDFLTGYWGGSVRRSLLAGNSKFRTKNVIYFYFLGEYSPKICEIPTDLRGFFRHREKKLFRKTKTPLKSSKAFF